MPRIRIITIVSLGLCFMLVPAMASLISVAVAQAPSSKLAPTKPDVTVTAPTTPDDTTAADDSSVTQPASTDTGTTDIEPAIRHKINIGRIFLNEVRNIPASQQPEEIASWLQLRLLGLDDSTLNLFLSTLELSCTRNCPASVQSARGIIQFELSSRNSTRDSAAIRKSRSGYHHSDDPTAQFRAAQFSIDLNKEPVDKVSQWLDDQRPVDEKRLEEDFLIPLHSICDSKIQCTPQYHAAIRHLEDLKKTFDDNNTRKLDEERDRLNRANQWNIAFIGLGATIMSLVLFLLDRKWPKPNANGPLLESIKAFLSKLATEHEAGPRVVKTDGDVTP